MLALLQEPPVDLQLRLADRYPLAEFVVARPFVVGRGPQGPVSLQGSERQLDTTTTFKFASRDKCWTVSVESNLIALTCTRYTEWPEFRDRIEEIIQAFLSTYKVTLTTRLGLRYRSVVNRKDLGLESVPWCQLLRPEVLGSWLFFADEIDEKSAANLSIDVEIPPGRVRIGLSTVASSSGDAGLMIDTDCYSEDQMDASPRALMGKAEEFHAYTSSVFQGCISDTLHAALLKPRQGDVRG